MSKIKLTNLTEGYLVINSIQVNNRYLSIPPMATTVIDAEYQDDSHIQELVRMKTLKVSEYVKEEVVEVKKGKGKSNKKSEGDKSGAEVTFMTSNGGLQKGKMVNSIADEEKKSDTPLIDAQEEDDDPSQKSDAFINV